MPDKSHDAQAKSETIKKNEVLSDNYKYLDSALRNVDTWTHYLDTLARHPHRSALNVAGIANSPLCEAKELRTFDEWSNLGARIKKGSKGISIVTNKDDTFKIERLYSEDQIIGANNRYRGLPTSDKVLASAMIDAALNENTITFANETEKWIVERHYGLNEGIKAPYEEAISYINQEESLMGDSPVALLAAVNELSRHVSKAIYSLDKDITESRKINPELNPFVHVQIPEQFTEKFLSQDETPMVRVTLPNGCLAPNGQEIGGYSFVCKESFTRGDGKVTDISFPTHNALDSGAWMVNLRRDFGHKDPEGNWISDIKEVSLSSTELSQSIREERKQYIAQRQEVTQKGELEARKNSFEPKQETQTMNHPTKLDRTSIESLAASATQIAKERNEARMKSDTPAQSQNISL